MTPINCQQCGGLTQFRIQPDGLFKCHECGDLLHRRDIDLAGAEVWTVNAEGMLGYVASPDASLTEMAEAVEEYLNSPDSTYGQLAALERHRTALIAFLEATAAGVKALPTYTEMQVHDAVNEGADIVNGYLDLGEPESDAINLVVNAAIACLEKPGTSFEEMVQSSYMVESPEEIRSWWGW
ncbi:hypothetical protein [Streptomyces sp. H27-H5]|uniref:hypothetical protein n=1 Tax=Streptomyces sp. H27-H5 TaxID=2996460 RepID=UPI00226F6A11|nr:hypothetical protein [Streptomyces sp. H27-H5]MCY0963409.1 hypothetical protein [Streptomyces sp. H27-H5]